MRGNLFAVAVDLVVLTVRDAELCALLVRRDSPPFAGRWGLPGGFVLPHEDLLDTATRRLGRGDRPRARRPPSRAARELRRSGPRPARTGPDGGPHRDRAPAAGADRRGGRLGHGLAPDREAGRRRRCGRPAGLRPRPDPRRRGGAGAVEAGVHHPRRVVLPAGVHGDAAAAGLRGGLAADPGPAQLPAQGHLDARLPRAHRHPRHRRARAAGAAVPPRPGRRRCTRPCSAGRTS